MQGDEVVYPGMLRSGSSMSGSSKLEEVYPQLLVQRGSTPDYPTLLFKRPASQLSGHEIYPQLVKQRSNPQLQQLTSQQLSQQLKSQQLSNQQLSQQLSQQLAAQQFGQQLSSQQLAAQVVSSQQLVHSAVVTAALEDIYPKMVTSGGRLVQVRGQGGTEVYLRGQGGEEVYPKMSFSSQTPP